MEAKAHNKGENSVHNSKRNQRRNLGYDPVQNQPVSQEHSIELYSVSKKFNIGHIKHENALYRTLRYVSGREQKKILQVLEDINLLIKKGERVGIIGRNGSGKSTLLRLIAGIYEHDGGKLHTNGSLMYISGFSQGLKSKLTMRENIFLVGSIMGLSQKEVASLFDEIISFSGLHEFVDTKVYQFSSGMITRLTFSVFIHCINHKRPEILLLDEVIGAGGDIDFTKKANEKMRQLVLSGSSVLFVSHGMGEIELYCQNTIWLEKGKVKMYGETKEVVRAYKESV
jgi:ABC-type polysaccharide/polyol phosphate transport system ATPase subunit